MSTALEHPWTSPPTPGTAVAVAPGVRWIRMPLPFALNHINLWLLEDDNGWVAIDTGIGLPDTRALWAEVFASGLDDRPLTRIVVTHFHPDHMGNADWLARRSGAVVSCTEPEWLTAHRVWRVRAPAEIERRLAHYRRHGLDETAVQQFRRSGNPYPAVVPSLPSEFRALADGDALEVGGRRWEVFTVRGHAPEHACLWNREDGVLIAGDQVLPKITTNVSVWPDLSHANPLRLYLDSLARFEPLPADTLVLPSHGLPFRGLHARLDGLRAHHDARLAETLDALDAPRTGGELVPVLFRRDMDIHQLGFAIGEVLAHLHLLEADGAVTRVQTSDVDRFRRE